MTSELEKLKHLTVDNNALWDIISGLVGYPAVLVSHQLKIFELLKVNPLSLQQVANALHIAERPAEAIINVNVALGLLVKINSTYALAPVAQQYLVEESPTYFGGLLDLVANNKFVTSTEHLKQAVISNSPQSYGGDDVFDSHKQDIENAEAFTRAMHSISMAPALVWPYSVNLSQYHCLLDVGGGSGAHAIGALRQWPQLSAIVFDIKQVCEIAQDYIHRYGLGNRMRTHAGDLWKTPFPASDIHFYSQIFHDWPLEKCQFLAKKSFDSLETGGLILIHEVLYNEDKTGPFIAAASSVSMLVWTEGRQYSGQELIKLLCDVGFEDINVKPSLGYWSLVSARKP